MDISQANTKIILLFIPNTYKIINVINNNINNNEFETSKLVGRNIYDWAKSIKPAPEEFGNLSSLLMAIKHNTPDDDTNYKFSNNGNFLTEYLLSSTKNNDIRINKFFWISYTYFGIYHSLNIYLSFKHKINNTDNRFFYSSASYDNGDARYNNPKLINKTFEHIRHELINPLQAIKISGDQIRKHIRQYKDQISPDDIDKFNSIILSQVDNSIDIIDTLTDTQDTDSESLPLSIALEKIPIPIFSTYIQTQIEKINQTYFMLEPIQIEWPNNQDYKSDYIFTHYVFISMNYMKIILDNIFKNIYGHLDSLKPESAPKNIIYKNKFIILVNNNQIELRIYNKISAKDRISYDKINWNTNKSTQHIINKYDLFISESATTHANQAIIHGSQNHITDIQNMNHKSNKGIGLTLINNLCRKMDVKWQLIDDDENICFILSIPVLTDTRQLPLQYEPELCQSKPELVLC